MNYLWVITHFRLRYNDEPNTSWLIIIHLLFKNIRSLHHRYIQFIINTRSISNLFSAYCEKELRNNWRIANWREEQHLMCENQQHKEAKAALTLNSREITKTHEGLCRSLECGYICTKLWNMFFSDPIEKLWIKYVNQIMN